MSCLAAKVRSGIKLQFTVVAGPLTHPLLAPFTLLSHFPALVLYLPGLRSLYLGERSWEAQIKTQPTCTVNLHSQRPFPNVFNRGTLFSRFILGTSVPENILLREALF